MFRQIQLVFVFDVLMMQVWLMFVQKIRINIIAIPGSRIAVLRERNTLDAALFNYHGN
jgi:hypothetical protein